MVRNRWTSEWQGSKRSLWKRTRMRGRILHALIEHADMQTLIECDSHYCLPE